MKTDTKLILNLQKQFRTTGFVIPKNPTERSKSVRTPVNIITTRTLIEQSLDLGMAIRE